MSTRSVILLGGGGHALVLFDTLHQLNFKNIILCAPFRQDFAVFQGLPWLQNDNQVLEYDPNMIDLVNGIGSTWNTLPRSGVYNRFKTENFNFINVIHPQSVISTTDVQMGEGVQVLAGAVVNPCVVLKNNIIINTRAVIEHESTILNHTHVASGAVICGGCYIGKNCHIGAGATINQDIIIGDGAVVASGAVVIHNVEPSTLVAGVPAKVKRIVS